MECKNGTCSASGGWNHQGSGCHGCNGCKSNCGQEKHCDTGCSECNKMVKIADTAWMNMMVRKMEKLWEEKMGEKMDGLAAASVETSMAYHMNMIKGKTEISEAAKKIKEAMSS